MKSIDEVQFFHYDVFMRTTMTIDDDLMLIVKRRAVETGRPVKEVINQSIRRGLESLQSGEEKEPYQCPVFAMGTPGYRIIDKALRVAEELEDEEITRKLQLKK
jgi:hypothetical protein